MITCGWGNKSQDEGVHLFYFSGKKNFGDQLNLDFLHHFSIHFSESDISNANVICIGSILDELLLTYSRRLRFRCCIHVIGSGFMMAQECPEERFNRPVEIHALRGKLSLKRCETMLKYQLSDVVLGDPGLLVNIMYPDISQEKRYDVGIICHFHDVDSKWLKNINLKRHTVCHIDVLSAPRSFVAQVASCRFILSSALHGVICADSFGIPNKPMVISGKVEGCGYKFKDYYSVFPDVDYNPVDLKDEIISDESIEVYQRHYVDVSCYVQSICERYTELFETLKNNVGVFCGKAV